MVEKRKGRKCQPEVGHNINFEIYGIGETPRSSRCAGLQSKIIVCGGTPGEGNNIRQNTGENKTFGAVPAVDESYSRGVVK